MIKASIRKIIDLEEYLVACALIMAGIAFGTSIVSHSNNQPSQRNLGASSINSLK